MAGGNHSNALPDGGLPVNQRIPIDRAAAGFNHLRDLFLALGLNTDQVVELTSDPGPNGLILRNPLEALLEVAEDRAAQLFAQEPGKQKELDYLGLQSAVAQGAPRARLLGESVHWSRQAQMASDHSSTAEDR